MSSRGGSGRPLTGTELSLIQAQRRAFDENTRFQEALHNISTIGARGADRAGFDVRDAASAAGVQVDKLGDLAQTLGLQRQGQRKVLLNDLLSSSLSLDALDPTGESLKPLQAAFSRASSQTTRPEFGDILSQNLDRAVDTPLSPQVGLLSSLGAAPSAAESALTPSAIQILSQAQGGQVPTAISSLLNRPDTTARSVLENQFDAARQRLIDSGVRGGALTRALAGLEGQRALGIGQQVENRERAATDATLGLLGQGVTFGLQQPFQREQLRLQGLGAAGGLAGQQEGIQQDALQSALQATQTPEVLRLQQLGLAGNLAGSLGNLNFGLESARNDALAREFGIRTDLAERLTAGADDLAFATAPALETQGVQLQNLIAESFGTPARILSTGGAGSGGVDLGSSLAAISNAQNVQQGPSRFATGASGALSGAASGAAIGTLFGPAGTGVGAAAGGLIGLLGGVL